jgi:hypothetical protein
MQLVYKQWLGKHVPAVNTPQQWRGCIFYVIRTATIAMQWCSKHASTIEAVFSAWFVPRSYIEDNWRYNAVEGSIVECQSADNRS